MVEYPDLQGKNILEIEPKYYNNLNIDGFSKMMKSPSYCYKFYWLEAIIQLISEGKTESTFDEIIDEMITNAWYSVREFHIHLSGMPLDGQIKDGLERAVLLLTELSELSANASKVEIKNAIKQYNNVMIIALAFMFSTVSVLSVLAGDIVLTKVDPRISLSEKAGRS